MLPTEIMNILIDNDPRVYNSLVRVMPMSAEAKEQLKKKMTGTVTLLKDPIPTTDGLIHTIGTDYKGEMNITASYGKLTTNPRGPSFSYRDLYTDIKIYATKGLLSRQRGPAVYVRDASANVTMSIYCRDGVVDRIKYVIRPRLECVRPDENSSTKVITISNGNVHTMLLEQNQPVPDCPHDGGNVSRLPDDVYTPMIDKINKLGTDIPEILLIINYLIYRFR